METNSVLVLGPYEYWVGRYSLSVCPGETSHNSGSGYLVTRRIWALWRTSKIMYWLSQVLEQHKVYYFGLPSSTHTLHPSRSSMLPEVSNKEPWAPHRLPWKACSEHMHRHITYMMEEGRLPLLRRSTAPHQCAHWRGPGFSALFQWTEQVPKSPEEWMASDFQSRRDRRTNAPKLTTIINPKVSHTYLPEVISSIISPPTKCPLRVPNTSKRNHGGVPF